MDERTANLQARRDRIISSAETLIIQDSLAAFKMRDLAEEGGLSVKTLYNLCGDKFAIAAEVERRAYATLEAELLSLPVLDDPIEQVLAVMQAGAQKAIDRKGIIHPLWRGGDIAEKPKSRRALELVQLGSHLAKQALIQGVDQQVFIAEVAAPVVAHQLSVTWFGNAMLWARDIFSDEAFLNHVRYAGLCNLLPYIDAEAVADVRDSIISSQPMLSMGNKPTTT